MAELLPASSPPHRVEACTEVDVPCFRGDQASQQHTRVERGIPGKPKALALPEPSAGSRAPALTPLTVEDRTFIAAAQRPHGRQTQDPATFAGDYKSGDLRILGVMAQEENSLFPGIKTLESQGYKLYMGTTRLLVTPTGLPKEVADTLGETLKKAIQSPEHVQKMTEAGYTVRYRTPEESDKMWAEMDEQVRPLVDLAKQQAN